MVLVLLGIAFGLCIVVSLVAMVPLPSRSLAIGYHWVDNKKLYPIFQQQLAIETHSYTF